MEIFLNIAAFFLSIFLSYMVVVWPITDYLERTIIIFIIFTILYYLFISKKIINFNNPLFVYANHKATIKEKHILKKALLYVWFVPSSIAGIGSLILLILTVYYLKLSEKFSGTQKFGDYSTLVNTIPKYIYLILFISLILFFLIQIYFTFKLKNTKKSTLIGLCFISIILVFFMCLFAILAGIIVYYIGGSLFY